MRIYEAKRNEAIRKIITSLTKAKNKEINFDKLLLMVMVENGVSKRTAKEYIEVAQIQI